MLTDFHIHSSASDDGHNTMIDMANASFSRGITTMCFTDHVELDDYQTGKPDPNAYSNKDEIFRQWREAKEKAPKGLEILCGIELGQANHDYEKAKEIASTEGLDFILGSVHNIKDTPDFSVLRYISVGECKEYISKYLEEIIEISKLDCFDVVSHIGYTQRYMLRDGFNLPINMNSYGDELTEVFKSIIENGKGIEINCSGLRNASINDTIPAISTIARYRELGGEIITVGSDAHTTKDASVGIEQGFEMLKAQGFEYFTIFRNRKPEFIKL